MVNKHSGWSELKALLALLELWEIVNSQLPRWSLVIVQFYSRGACVFIWAKTQKEFMHISGALFLHNTLISRILLNFQMPQPHWTLFFVSFISPDCHALPGIVLLNCSPSKVAEISNPQYLWMWPYLEIESGQVIKLKRCHYDRP